MFGLSDVAKGLTGEGGAAFLGGLFGDSGAPYEDAGRQFKKYFEEARNTQNPFYRAGTSAIPQFQNWLQGMSNPSAFINNLMGSYQESPYARYQQNQAMRAAQNLGSATGLTGSTPLMQQAQQNASNISSQDMNTWLQNVLGINTQYGSGLNNLINGGQISANTLTDLINSFGGNMAGLAYNQRAAENNDFFNTLGGGLKIASMFI